MRASSITLFALAVFAALAGGCGEPPAAPPERLFQQTAPRETLPPQVAHSIAIFGLPPPPAPAVE
jgi:hypothetical protein